MIQRGDAVHQLWPSFVCTPPNNGPCWFFMVDCRVFVFLYFFSHKILFAIWHTFLQKNFITPCLQVWWNVCAELMQPHNIPFHRYPVRLDFCSVWVKENSALLKPNKIPFSLFTVNAKWNSNIRLHVRPATEGVWKLVKKRTLPIGHNILSHPDFFLHHL